MTCLLLSWQYSNHATGVIQQSSEVRCIIAPPASQIIHEPIRSFQSAQLEILLTFQYYRSHDTPHRRM